MDIKLKRIYVAPDPLDGYRVLVDRLWPRGIAKREAHIDAWWKHCAPSAELRQWFGHDPEKWALFQSRYTTELHANRLEVSRLLAELPALRTITLLFGAKDEKHNNAVVLKRFIATRFQ